jgi:large subunit ribosomal protein L6
MKIKIPEGVSVTVEGDLVKVKGKTVSSERAFNPLLTAVKVEAGEIDVSMAGKPSQKKHAVENVIASHVKNMIKGDSTDFVKTLKVVFAHFPVSVEVKGNLVLIKNFVGEKTPRTAKIRGKTKVEVKGAEIIVSGRDKEAMSQTASNIVKATKILNRDERVFQDGIYYA